MVPGEAEPQSLSQGLQSMTSYIQKARCASVHIQMPGCYQVSVQKRSGCHQVLLHKGQVFTGCAHKSTWWTLSICLHNRGHKIIKATHQSLNRHLVSTCKMRHSFSKVNWEFIAVCLEVGLCNHTFWVCWQPTLPVVEERAKEICI